MQTIVYRYLAVEAGAALNGGEPPAPEQVEMVYWFAQSNGATQRFAFDAAQHAAARTHLAGLIAQIAARTDPVWPLTADQNLCRLCNYRSLCERGIEAAFLDKLEDDFEPLEAGFDLEQIAEVEF